MMETDSMVESEDSYMNNTEELEIAEETKQSNTPKPISHLIPKKQPEILCNCPSQCDKKFSKEWRQSLYQHFHRTFDHAAQNEFIQRHIKIKSIAQRLWEDDIIEKKTQRRVTCKYLIPLTGSVEKSFRYAKTLTFATVNPFGEKLVTHQNGCNSDHSKDLKQEPKVNSNMVNGHDSCSTDSITNESASKLSTPTINGQLLADGLHNKLIDSIQKEVTSHIDNSSINDSESLNLEDADDFDSDSSAGCAIDIQYAEVCQKAFMNMYGITEKRIRWQREKLIIISKYEAEKKRKELEEMDRTLSLARSLGAGCQPLLAMLEKSNCAHLSEQLMGAIEDDVALVNNFFYNQLWKPEDIMKKSVNLSKFDQIETDCD